MLEGCLILLVVLILLGAWIVSIIPWPMVILILACIWIVGIFTDEDEY
jgi:hypothetical protein